MTRRKKQQKPKSQRLGEENKFAKNTKQRIKRCNLQNI